MLKKMKITASVLLVIVMTAFNLSLDGIDWRGGLQNGHFIQLDFGNKAYASVGPFTIANVNSELSGSGGRKITRLSNGWIISAVGDTDGAQISFYKSTDGGATWSTLTSLPISLVNALGYAITSYGTTVYAICAINGSECCLKLSSFDATAVTSPSWRKIDPGNDPVFWGGISLTADASGTLYAAWSSRCSPYNNSVNICFAKSTDGGTTWKKANSSAGIDLVTTYNNTSGGYYMTEPSITINSSNYPVISYEDEKDHYGSLSCATFNGTSWSLHTILGTGDYQMNPCMLTKKSGSNSGRIWVAWEGRDGIDYWAYNIRVSYSDDNGATWSTPAKITSGNSELKQNAMLSEDAFGNVYVMYNNYTNIYYQKCNNGTTSFGGVISLGAGTQPSAMEHEFSYIWKTAASVQYASIDSLPTINVISPLVNCALSEQDTNFIPQISVSDTDNDTLTCKYYIDAETTPRDTKTVSNTATAQTVNFSALNVSPLTEGSHNIKYEVNDGKGPMVTSTVSFQVDKSSPAIGTVTVTSATSSVTVSGSATDSIAGLDALPYRYTVGTNPATAWLASSSYTQNSLMPNTQYTVKFEAKDAKGHIAQNTQNIYTKAEVPSLAVNNPTSNTLDVNTTDNNPASTQYQISVNGTQYLTQEGTLTASPAWLTFTGKKVTVRGLSPNTTYTFTAKAKNAEGIETSISAPVSSTTLIEPPAPPVNLTAAATGNSVTVNWDAAAGATGYEIEAGGMVVDTGTGTTYTHIGLTPDTQYTYRVRARNAGGAGAWSSPITKSTQALSPWVPLNVNAATTTTSVIITWDAVGGASGYDIEADGNVVNNGSSTNYIHNGLIPGTQHSYRVRSINSGGKSDWSNEVLIYTLAEKPPVPVNLGGTAARDQITLSWEAVTGAVYDLKIDGIEVENITGTIYAHDGLMPGTQHTYQIRAKKNGGTSEWSTTLTLFTLPDTFGIPSGFKAEAADTSILLSWNTVAGATGYDVEVDGAVLDNGTSTTCIHNGLTPGTTHSYRVRAKSAAETSDWTTLTSVSTCLLPVPASVTATAADNTIMLNWGAVTGADSYDLDVDGTVIQSITATSYTCSGFAPNTQHIFKVRAVGASGMSAWSAPLAKSTEFNGYSVPANLTAISRGTAISVIWSAVANATAYDLEIDGTVTENITGTSYTHTGLSAGTQHTYRIRAKKDAVIGNWSNILTASTLPDGPAMPANVTASATTTTTLVTWDGVDNVTGYDVEVDGSVMDNGTGTSYLHRGLSPATQHTYRVRAKNASGASEWSSAVTLSTRSSTDTYNISCTSNEVFSLTFAASDIQAPNAYTFTVTYDTGELEVLDLCASTPRVDLTTGNLIGTDVQVLQFAPGTIVFKKITSVQPGQTWSGAVNSIKFKAKAGGQAAVTYSIQ